MKNRLKFIANIGVYASNVVNYWIKTWRRFAVNSTMDLYSLRKFKNYMNDWNYPVQFRYPDQIIPKTKCSNFQTAIRAVIIVGQFFGLNPVLGVCEKDADNLRFKLISWRCAYALISLVGQIWMVCVLITSLFKSTSTSTVDSATALLFYFIGLLATALFLRIAMKWPNLCKQISQMEVDDPTTDSKLGIKFNVTCFGVLALAFLEHLFSEIHGISVAIDCGPDNTLYESFIKHSSPWIFTVIPYSTFVAVLSQIVNIQCTFNWNFTDLFVICMSLYLTSRLEQVNRRVVAAKDKNSPPAFWRTMREDYNRATHLVRQVDNIIGGVIFVSFASNLFFVCSQLMHTVAEGIHATGRCRNEDTPDGRYMNGYEHSVYFIYSFIFLVARSLAVSLTASRVHSASLEPAYALYDVSSTTYCIEIERFLDQIHGNTVALSGLQFFNVKRGLILTDVHNSAVFFYVCYPIGRVYSQLGAVITVLRADDEILEKSWELLKFYSHAFSDIAGTIVTYELVLMQFTGITPTSPPPLQV